MYCFTKVCFICLKHTDNENYTILQNAGNKTVQQMKFVIPEITNLELRLPLVICSTCRQALDDFHNFKKKCIENSCRYIDYTNKLQGPHGSSKGTFDELQVKINNYKLLITVKEEEHIDPNIETEKVMLEEVMLDFTEALSTSEDSTDPLFQQSLKNGTEFNHGQDCDPNISCVDQMNKVIKENLNFTEELSISDDNIVPLSQQILKNETESKHGQDCDRNINCVDQTTEEKNYFLEYKFLELKAEENLLEEEVNIKKIIDFNEELSEDNKDSLPQKILKNETQFNLVKDRDRKITEDNNHSSEQEVTNELFQATDLKCLVCNAGFVEKSHLQNHMMAHYNDKQRKCFICDKIFKNVSTLHRHMNAHTDLINYKCSICNKTFGRKVQLQRHMVVHTGVKDYKCSICNKLFGLSSNLKKHMAVHSDVKNYKCSICKKTFKESTTLKKHMTIHTSVKDYKCSICNRLFGLSSNLKTHMAVHSDVKDYKCSICKKTFKLSSILKRHMTIHTSVKDYKCSICNKLFLRNEYLKNHMKRHTGMKEFECVLCNKKFVMKRKLELHLKRHNQKQQDK